MRRVGGILRKNYLLSVQIIWSVMGMPEIGRKWGSLAGQIIQHMYNSESLTAGIELSLAQKKCGNTDGLELHLFPHFSQRRNV
jgi:hypothetical protein